MWEDAAPKDTLPAAPPAPQTPPAKPGTPAKAGPSGPPPRQGGEDLVLWVQIALCGLLLAAVLGARAFQPALFAKMRVAYTAALAERGPFLGEDRQFTRFAQQAFAALDQAAQAVRDRLGPGQTDNAAATPETADTPAGTAAPEGPAFAAAPDTGADLPLTNVAHRRARPAPAGCRAESYLPAFPLILPLKAETWPTSPYGWRTEPVQGEADEFHTGADLHADEGTPVYAAAAGVVRRAGHGATYGNYLRILHANGDETLYAHLQYLFVRTGQSVAAGEQIGTSGHTGNVTGPHLHFELLHEGVRYDPTEALAAAR